MASNKLGHFSKSPWNYGDGDDDNFNIGNFSENEMTKSQQK